MMTEQVRTMSGKGNRGDLLKARDWPVVFCNYNP